MAATRLIPLHVNKGKTVAKCLKDRTDYSVNEEKTQHGEYISSYRCDLKTVDEEFLLTKRQYHHITGRTQKDDIIAYQIRQSFKPGEVTPEEANKIGHELAMSFTKGKHAFIVATHVDKAHIHNHIIYNSTALDCTRKFKNFFLSSFAIQRISDTICLQHGLSVIKPKPYGERQKRTEYAQKESFREKICASVDEVMQKNPEDIEALFKLLEECGYEVKRGKNAAVRGMGQKRFIRFRSLGEGYTITALEKSIWGESQHRPKYESEKRPFDLLINIQEKIKAGKGGGYERWAKVFNIKQLSQALLFLQEHDIRDMDKLESTTNATVERFNALSKTIKDVEQRMEEISALRKHIINYVKTREVYVDYRKAGYSKKFFEEHREEIALHQAAKKAFTDLQMDKIPRLKELNEEYTKLLFEKRQTCSEYRQAKKEMQDFLIAKKNVEAILNDKKEKQEKKNRKGAFR